MDVVNAIFCELPILDSIQHKLVNSFPSFRLTNYLVLDISNKAEQTAIMTGKQHRAHLAAQEITKQVLHDYFPQSEPLSVGNSRKSQHLFHANIQPPPKNKTGIKKISYHIKFRQILSWIGKLFKFAIVRPIDSSINKNIREI